MFYYKNKKIDFYNKIYNLYNIISLAPKMNKSQNSSSVELILDPNDYELIDVSKIEQLPSDYPNDFIEFCKENNISLPSISSENGIALSLMLKYRYYYFNRETCIEIQKKFNLSSKDNIQLFNKQNQRGIKTNSDLNIKGKYFIIYPYALSNKSKMRKNFKFDGSEDQKNLEIYKIKQAIKADYIEVPNELWQLGHKNPGSIDSSNNNLVLQPPIQGKYRDDYIFIDTLTKIPVPNKLKMMIQKKEIELTKDQICMYKKIFDELFTSI